VERMTEHQWQDQKGSSFVNCIDLIDGTLFPLDFAPMVNGEDYYTRKGNYAIKGLVICDDAERITWVEMGRPGSVHDNCIWANSEIYLSKDKYFEPNGYLIGDSAFSTSAVMIPAFKKGHNRNLSEEQRYFNSKLLQRSRSNLNILLGYSRHGFSICKVFGG